jgi:hypothetical protein
MVIVSHVENILLYAIPELKPVREGFASQVLAVTPLVVHDNLYADEQTLLWNSFCEHHSGNRIPTAAASENDVFHLIILPPAGQREGVIVRHEIGVGDFGPSRAVWSVDQWDEIGLQSCTHFTRPDNHVGYMRLGRSKPADPSRIISIPLAGEVGEVLDVSFDEQSSLIFILAVFREGERLEVEKRRLLMVELI